MEEGAQKAREIMRTAVYQMDRVVIFRRPEEINFTEIVNFHFGLSAGRPPGNKPLADNKVNKPFSLSDIRKRDRRWVLDEVRKGMLSISFHINTGVCLYDVDSAHRNIGGGFEHGPADRPIAANTEGYVYGGKQVSETHQGVTKQLVQPNTGLLSGFKNGEIHIAFWDMQNYTPAKYARVIIHEAAHKYWAVKDHAYAHQTAEYENLTYEQAIDNADSYAWGAVSLSQGVLNRGV